RRRLPVFAGGRLHHRREPERLRRRGTALMNRPPATPSVPPEGFTWPNGAKLALSIVVNVEEGAEQNIVDGDKGPEPVDELSASPKRAMRVHGNESNYQYGIRAGAPRVLRVLDE